MTCPECGGRFTPARTRGRYQITCSEPCRTRRRLRQRAAASRRNKARARVNSAARVQGSPVLGIDVATLTRIQYRHSLGASPAALAQAFGLNVRSVYRYLMYGPPQEVVIGKWRATFASNNRGRPRQLTQWRHVTDDSEH